jgi:hypothetical protein
MTRPRPYKAIRTPTYSPTVTPDVQADAGLDPDPPSAPRPTGTLMLEVAIGFEQDLPITSRTETFQLDPPRTI